MSSYGELVKTYPNKYNLTPERIKTLRILDWERLKRRTWYNEAVDPPCWCHLEGCNLSGGYDDEDEFWIGFYGDDSIAYYFTTYGGMCHYEFDRFYDVKDIETKADMNVQVNAIKYLNRLLDEGILGL